MSSDHLLTALLKPEDPPDMSLINRISWKLPEGARYAGLHPPLSWSFLCGGVLRQAGRMMGGEPLQPWGVPSALGRRLGHTGPGVRVPSVTAPSHFSRHKAPERT